MTGYEKNAGRSGGFSLIEVLVSVVVLSFGLLSLRRHAALLICSDGLTDQVPAEAIRQVVRSAGGSPEPHW